MLALVWWLFESGLRTEVIKRVLRDLSKSNKADANSAGKLVRKSGAEYLTITRDARRAGSKQPNTPQAVEIGDFSDVDLKLQETDNQSLHVIKPVRRRLLPAFCARELQTINYKRLRKTLASETETISRGKSIARFPHC